MSDWDREEMKLEHLRAKCLICSFISIAYGGKSATYHHQQHMLKKHKDSYVLIDHNGRPFNEFKAVVESEDE